MHTSCVPDLPCVLEQKERPMWIYYTSSSSPEGALGTGGTLSRLLLCCVKLLHVARIDFKTGIAQVRSTMLLNELVYVSISIYILMQVSF